MAKQPNRSAPNGKGSGKAGKGKPITSHQLFPAVVALWFGALFGLGSLAVRPSLLESLVIKSRLDLIVPAAAPPLGITARILIALILAALGSIIGVLIARRFNRPKAEVRQRKRSAKAAAEAPRSSYFGKSEPANVFEEAASSGGVLAGRRRGSLAFEHDEVEFVPHEMAPLPGGAPQVLDISGIELADHEPARDQAAPLDLAAFALPEPAPASLFAAAPVQSFQPLTQEPVAAAGPYDHTPQAYLPAEPTPAQRQIFGMPVENDHVDQSFLREAGFKTSVFETEESTPLFPDRQPQAAAFAPPVAEPTVAAPTLPEPSMAEPTMAAAPAFAPPVAEPIGFTAPEPQAFAPPPAMPAMLTAAVAIEPVPQPAADPAPAFAAPVDAPAFTAPVEPNAGIAPEPEPAPAPAPAPTPTPTPTAGLGMTDLATRLQQSMQRRRATPTAAPVAEPAPQPVAEQPEPAAPMLAAFAPPVADAPAAQAPAPAEAAAFAQPAAEDLADFTPPAPFIAPFAVEAVTPPPPFAAPEPVLAAPAAPSLLSPAPVQAAPAPAVDIPPPPMAMPAALRPLNLDQEMQDDDDMLASLLPPRHVPMPPPVPVASEPAPAPFASFAPVASPEPAAEPEAVAEEENYASLLDIGQPLAARSNGFVRVEEPEEHGAAIEPVVIFPGQGAFAAPQAAPFGQTPVAPIEASGDAVPFRRFDAPSAAGQGVPVAAPIGAQATNPAEAEQALRAALANLQRMSGAA